MPPKASSLSRLKVQELRDACEEKGLPTTGTKAVLIERLLEAEEAEAKAAEADAPPTEAVAPAPQSAPAATAPPPPPTAAAPPQPPPPAAAAPPPSPPAAAAPPPPPPAAAAAPPPSPPAAAAPMPPPPAAAAAPSPPPPDSAAAEQPPAAAASLEPEQRPAPVVAPPAQPQAASFGGCDLGFFGGGAVDLSDSEEEEEAEAAPPEPAREPPPEPAPEPEAAVEAPPPARKRKTGLLSPDEAAALVAAAPHSYVHHPGAEAVAGAAYIGTDASRTVDISDAVASTLLAGGGRGVRELEQSTGCRCVVEQGARERGAQPGLTRRLTLVGSDSALRCAEKRLQEYVAASGDATSRVLRCSSAQAAQLIGRGGATIKRLQAATTTHLDVSGRERAEGEQRTVTIKGLPWHVDNAARFIYSFWREPEALESLLDEAQAALKMKPAQSAYGDAAAYGR